MAKDKTKVVYLNLPAELAAKLASDADDQMRPMSVHAAWIIKRYYSDTRVGKTVNKRKKGS